MMSTRSFSRNASLWSPLAPTMEPVVRWLNTQQVTYGRKVATLGGEPANNALIAESAFLLAARNFRASGRGLTAGAAAKQAQAFLMRFDDYPSAGIELDPDEFIEVLNLARSIRRYLGEHAPNPLFGPEVPGCGSVEAGHADILAGNTLIEVKSVTRAFRGQDVRQVLTYAAMYYASGVNIETAVFLNPRRGRFVAVSLEFLCQGSSGQPRATLLQDIVDTMGGLQVSA